MSKRLYNLATLGALMVALPTIVIPTGSEPVPGLTVREGLDAVTFAKSPMLTNPTNLAVDARGRVWVTEGYNYRTQLHPDHPVREKGDRILILEDTDGDGQADKEKVYYQGHDVDAAEGIAVLGNKVIVSAYKNVFLFTDTNGDDVPDEKKVLYTFKDINHDHTVHAFVFGPDGRLYFNIGNASEFVADPAGNVIVDAAGNRVTADGHPYREGMTFRVEPDGSRFEVLGNNFRNPYEVTIDSYGTVWQSDNDDDGNRSVRINYVMEYGNYGYTDEMTGAGWRTRRVGWSDEIPRRHWHQNDPGVVPNMLITGAGSPSGITVYEGDLLPQVFQGALIHADAGPGVVRAYPVKPDGAGYSAEIVNILTATNDDMFRPVDVAVAPDGSLFVADWYDPDVGGHDVVDLDHGRIIRIAPTGTPYHVAAVDLSTPAGAVAALRDPDMDTRYQAYQKLAAWGAEAQPALEDLWHASEPRQRARALWLLSALPNDGSDYIDEALRDPDPNIRITALRAVRRLGWDVIPYAQRLVDDSSPAVRREVALALHNDDSPQAAGLWAQLAEDYDGQDRWYLEALGIGAAGHWDADLSAWRARVGDAWMQPAGRDIIWRARNDAVLPMLADLIRDPSTTADDRLRYFRAFDFHQGAARQRVLAGLLEGDAPDQAEITALALMQMDSVNLASSPAVKTALDATLDRIRGTERFVELAAKFGARDRTDELVRLAIEMPDSAAGVDAAALALRWNAANRFADALATGSPDTTSRVLAVLGNAGGEDAGQLIESVALDASRPLAVRESAARALGRNPGGERELLALLRDDRLPEDLKPVATTILFSSYRSQTREAAAMYLTPPATTTADGKQLPDAGTLAREEGDATRGAAVFQQNCASCHRVGDAGVDFGPNLSEIGDKLSNRALYTAILHPSAGVGFGYEGYVVRLKDGSEAVGYVASETPTELALRRVGGITSRYPTTEIASRTPLPGSLMPEGLEQAMTEQELIDLVEYLSTLEKPE